MTHGDTSELKASHKIGWDRAIMALLQGATMDKAAEAAGVDPATLYRWQKDPRFQAALLEARRSVFGQAMGRLQHASNTAIGTLIGIMSDPEAPVGARVQASNNYPGRAWNWTI